MALQWVVVCFFNILVDPNKSVSLLIGGAAGGRGVNCYEQLNRKLSEGLWGLCLLLFVQVAYH